MFVFLTPPVLLAGAAAIAAILLWSRRGGALPADAVPWVTIGMGLLAVAMAILLVATEAPAWEQGLRAGLLLEACLGVWLLGRRTGGRGRDAR
ncbi:MAG: hypothetical protein ACOY3Y_20530 [Acidobacteriota bacterium]